MPWDVKVPIKDMDSQITIIWVTYVFVSIYCLFCFVMKRMKCLLQHRHVLEQTFQMCVPYTLFVHNLELTSRNLCKEPPTIVQSFPLRLSKPWKHAQVECQTLSGMQKQDLSVRDSAVQMSRYWCVAPHLSLEAVTGSNSYTHCPSSCTGKFLRDLRLCAVIQNKSAQTSLTCLKSTGIAVLCLHQSAVTKCCEHSTQVGLVYPTCVHDTQADTSVTIA